MRIIALTISLAVAIGSYASAFAQNYQAGAGPEGAMEAKQLMRSLADQFGCRLDDL